MTNNISIEKVRQSRIGEVDFNDIPFGRIFSDHMFMADFYDGAWRDARIVPFGKFPFHPASTALHYGQSIFEGLKAYNGKNGDALIFRPDMNLKRMNRSAFRMAMPEFPEPLFFQALKELVSLDRHWIPHSPGSALYIRPFMYATDEYVGIKPADTFRFIMFTCPVGAYYSQPVKVLIDERFVRAFPGGVGMAKAAGNYGATLYPVKLAREKGFDQLLWLDGLERKYIQEIGTMNVFFKIGKTVVTPSLDEGTILEGITRDSVIQLLKMRGVAVEQRRISVQEVLDAHREGELKDAFGTGTAATISPIAALGYNDEIFPISANGESVSKSLNAEMQNILWSKTADVFNWMYRIKIPVAKKAVVK